MHESNSVLSSWFSRLMGGHRSDTNDHELGQKDGDGSLRDPGNHVNSNPRPSLTPVQPGGHIDQSNSAPGAIPLRWYPISTFVIALWMAYVAGMSYLFKLTADAVEELEAGERELPYPFIYDKAPFILQTIFTQAHVPITAYHLSRLAVSALQRTHMKVRTWRELFWSADRAWQGPFGMATILFGAIKERRMLSLTFTLFIIVSLMALATPFTFTRLFSPRIWVRSQTDDNGEIISIDQVTIGTYQDNAWLHPYIGVVGTWAFLIILLTFLTLRPTFADELGSYATSRLVADHPQLIRGFSAGNPDDNKNLSTPFEKVGFAQPEGSSEGVISSGAPINLKRSIRGSSYRGSAQRCGVCNGTGKAQWHSVGTDVTAGSEER